MTMEHPLSPFMFPTWYRFQITSALSILHRLTGIALAVGSILLAWWLVAVAAGGQMFAAMHAFLASPIGVLLLFLWSVAFSTTCAAASGISPGTPATGSRSGTPIAAATPCSPRRSS
jgi:succinate dehydrogenase cytochrome b556 subunit